jgi:hypothetical protein
VTQSSQFRERKVLMSSVAAPVRLRAVSTLVGVCVLVAACTGATSPGPQAPSSAPSTDVVASAPASIDASLAPASAEAIASAPDASPQPTAVPTSLSPCSLVTQDEASALANFSAGKGKESTDANGRNCSYSQAGLLFDVRVVVAPDAATAKAGEPAFKASLEEGAKQAGLTDVKLTELPNFEPGVDAATITGSATVSGVKLKASALYALKGAVLVAITILTIGGAAVPTSEAMQAQARTTLGRLP